MMNVVRTMILSGIILYLGCQPGPAKVAKTFEKSNFDTTVAACDDFYQYTNGGWIKNNPVPAAYGRWSAFNELADFNTNAIRTILEEAAADKNAKPGSQRQMTGDFYASGMDSAAIEAMDLKPLGTVFGMIDGMKDKTDLARVLAELHHYGMAPMFNFFAAQDDKNSTMMIAVAYQGGLGMPDRDYYLDNDEKTQKIREAYKSYIKALSGYMGMDEKTAASNLETIMKIETGLARASKTRVEQRDPEKNYNKLTVADLEKLVPTFDWNTYFTEIGLQGLPELNVAQTDFFAGLNNALKTFSIEEWKPYLKMHTLNYAAPYLGSKYVDAHFAFTGTALRGTTELLPRWKRVSQTTDRNLGEVLGQVYVERYFPPSAKARAMEMVNNVREAFRDRLMRIDWMTDSTRAKALAKLNTFTVKIGYPDKWKDYTGLQIDRTSYLKNVMAAQKYDFRRDMGEIGKPVDRTKWGMTPPTVNAYYNPSMNEIVFPAGIMQYPFFNPDADDAFNYGGMGSVIGHEITHGFDDQGSQYDAEGNLKNWWSKADRENFEERANKMVRQYGRYEALDGLNVNGALTLGENIADLGGLYISYEALEKTLKGKAAKLIDGYTPEQRFFMAWAQVWRNTIRDEEMRFRVKVDPHSPGKFRVKGPLSNIPEFEKAFGCADGQYLEPDSSRVQIW